MVGTPSAVEPNDSQEGLAVSRSELGEVFRAEGPRQTPVQQGLNHLGLQYADFPSKQGGCSTIQLRTEPSEACPHVPPTGSTRTKSVDLFLPTQTPDSS